MNLTYVPTIKDYRAGLRLHFRLRLTRRIAHLLGLWMLPSFFLLFSAPMIYKMLTQPEEYSGVLGWLVIGFAFSLIVPLRQYYCVNKQFKALFQNSLASREVSVEISNDRILSAIPGMSEGTFYWKAILDFAQDENVTLLYVAENRFLFIPTQAMSPAQRTELDDLVARNLVRKS